MSIDADKILQIKRLWDEGKTKSEISRKLGVNPATVARYLGAGTQYEYQKEQLKESMKGGDAPNLTQRDLDDGIQQAQERRSVEEASEVLKDSVSLAAKVWHDALAGTADINPTQFNTAKAILKKHGLLAEDEQVATKSVYDTMSDGILAKKVVEAARAIGIELAPERPEYE